MLVRAVYQRLCYYAYMTLLVLSVRKKLMMHGIRDSFKVCFVGLVNVELFPFFQENPEYYDKFLKEDEDGMSDQQQRFVNAMKDPEISHFAHMHRHGFVS